MNKANSSVIFATLLFAVIFVLLYLCSVSAMDEKYDVVTNMRWELVMDKKGAIDIKLSWDEKSKLPFGAFYRIELYKITNENNEPVFSTNQYKITSSELLTGYDNSFFSFRNTVYDDSNKVQEYYFIIEILTDIVDSNYKLGGFNDKIPTGYKYTSPILRIIRESDIEIASVVSEPVKKDRLKVYISNFHKAFDEGVYYIECKRYGSGVTSRSKEIYNINEETYTINIEVDSWFQINSELRMHSIKNFSEFVDKSAEVHIGFSKSITYPYTAVSTDIGAVYNEYTDQFHYYVDCASQTDLIPSLESLDDLVNERYLLDFILQFLKVKCGVDADAHLSKARTSNLSAEQRKNEQISSVDEDRVKVAAINEILFEEVWSFSSSEELDNNVELSRILGLFRYIAYKYTAPLSPLLFSGTTIPRYNFSNIPTVVCHEEVLVELMSEIIGLSQGESRMNLSYHLDESISNRQFAAFCYMFSTMCLPKDPGDKYPGAISCDTGVDGFVTNILDKVITPGMTEYQKVKAIYDHMLNNFDHDDHMAPVISSSKYISTNPLHDTINFAMPIIVTGKGTCDAFANTFRLLSLRLGFECNYVSGQFVNQDGSKRGHGWNQIKVEDEWYWIDVDVEGTEFRRGNYSEPLYFLFMKKDSEWAANHQWDEAEWPAADETKHPLSMSVFSIPNPASITSDGSIIILIGSKNIYRGNSLLEEPLVIPQTINGRTMLPFRYLVETVLGGEVNYYAATRCITANIQGHEVVMFVDKLQIVIDGVEYEYGQAPVIVNGSTLVPLRAFEQVISDLKWDAETQTVTIIP